MAPEQADGHDVDCRADIFAFGAVLYQMFTGRSAFPTKDFATVPPPISEVQPHLPNDLDVIICRCLAHAPCDRWPSIAELRTELTRILASSRP
jgi:serine/threonine protein kinase